MEDKDIIEILTHQIHCNSKICFESQEQYYFALSQALAAVFAELGGIDRYRCEFNYLTNPYLPLPVHDLAKRILRFFVKYKNRASIANNPLERTITALVAASDQFVHATTDTKKAELAFYEGLYHDNIL